ncbi:hypothetical protein VEIDISOL_01048 [Veillonella dispar ATCC 17748]|uniref:Uncharacterized protein n=2 Tax=Veillonella dispar TaxID=39778 RepID=C4FQI0_9FIRM|nr:hypothetical protein [Veillonella dispar]EEP65173.1 hypothetical protein VEIDISOL_01048 [Veillonella dispar ATCC 17748]VEG93468.1 Uncharacterised protein [Veillonella dispar]
MEQKTVAFTESALLEFYEGMDTIRSLFIDREHIYYLLDNDSQYSIEDKLKQILNKTRLNINLLGFNTKQRKNVVFDEMEIENLNIFLNLNDIDYTVTINVGLTGDITMRTKLNFSLPMMEKVKASLNLN